MERGRKKAEMPAFASAANESALKRDWRMEKPKEEEGKLKRLLLYILGALGAIALACVGLLLIVSVVSAVKMPGLGGGCVGVVKIEGELTTQEVPKTFLSPGVLGSESIAKNIEDLGKRDDVKSILVIVDSPGGSVVASREIYEAVKAVKKPKVSYFREVAASGGYYVAAGTDYIVSDPDAITGSIGVRTTSVELSELFKKVGVNMTTVTSGAHKDMGDVGRPLTDDEKEIMKALVDEVFTEFKDAVVSGRGDRLDSAEFEKVLDGRILTGRQALRVGLVDETGNKKRALLKAAQLGNITVANGDEPPVCEIDGGSGGLGGLFSSVSYEIGNELGKGFLSGISSRVQLS